jgi:hypothetical protein
MGEAEGLLRKRTQPLCETTLKLDARYGAWTICSLFCTSFEGGYGGISVACLLVRRPACLRR